MYILKNSRIRIFLAVIFGLTSFALSNPENTAAFEMGEDWMQFDTSPPISPVQGALAVRALPILSKDSLRLMAAAASRYDTIVRAGGWQKIPNGEKLVVGMVDPRVRLLRQRLILTGDLKQRVGFSDTLDSFVAESVRRFQKRNGLRPNGMVGRRTLQALNVSAEKRLSQIRLNLSRISKLTSRKLPKRFVMVNIPASELEAVENNKVARRHRVVVGKPQFQTPDIAVKIIQLNFYPYWRVPDSIAGRDILPQLAKGRNYLEKTRTRVLDGWGGKEVDPKTVNWKLPTAARYKFRQDPGEGNALGVLRLNMPNKHIVYLHDTPLKRLFGRDVRAYSAGCVRVQNILGLANWLLKPNGGWDRRRIDDVVEAGKSKNVSLKKRVPVFFSYITAWGSSDGSVNFRSDIYDRDKTGGLVKDGNARDEKAT